MQIGRRAGLTPRLQCAMITSPAEYLWPSTWYATTVKGITCPRDKLLDRILSGSADANISFADLCQLLRRLGFEERIRGSHHIFTKYGVEEILNLQSKGANSKPYQVK